MRMDDTQRLILEVCNLYVQILYFFMERWEVGDVAANKTCTGNYCDTSSTLYSLQSSYLGLSHKSKHFWVPVVNHSCPRLATLKKPSGKVAEYFQQWLKKLKYWLRVVRVNPVLIEAFSLKLVMPLRKKFQPFFPSLSLTLESILSFLSPVGLDVRHHPLPTRRSTFPC
jgi:hypothetical protein